MPIGRPKGQRTPDLLHPNTATRLRKFYREQWSQEWPHDDRFLKELWDESKAFQRRKERQDNCLMAMRENDTTIPPEYGRTKTQQDEINGNTAALNAAG